MSRTRRAFPRLLAATAVSLLVNLLSPAAAADRIAFTLEDPRITESSGLVSDPAENRYWTVNDSGSDGVAYAVQPDGEVSGTLRFRAQPIDVEAVAMFKNRLYVADIGDNRAQREFVTVYSFDDPTPGAIASYRAYDFAYPDGAHDAETLLVDSTGRLFVVTKESGAGIYASPGQPSRRGVNELIKVGRAPAYVTDGVFLPGGERIALRTYLSVHVLDAQSYDTVAQAAAPLQPQGESIAVGLKGTSLLLGSEGSKSAVYRVPIPARLADVPSAGPSPPGPPKPSPTPSPTPSATPEETEEAEETVAAGDQPSRRGTLLALGLAGVVALLAGVAVAAVRRPQPRPAARRSRLGRG
jgi:hypothetical protein